MYYTVFNHNTSDEDLIEDFEKTMKKLELEPLFTDEHKSTSITVSWAMLKNLVNGGSSYQTLKTFSDYIKTSDDNKMYASVMLRTLNMPANFENLIKNVKKVNEYISHGILDKHMHNKWNIVWYNEDLY